MRGDADGLWPAERERDRAKASRPARAARGLAISTNAARDRDLRGDFATDFEGTPAEPREIAAPSDRRARCKAPTAMRACSLLLVVACAQHPTTSPDGGGSGSCSKSAATVSFQHDVVPLIGHCGSEQCHGGIVGTTWPYASLVNQPATECSNRKLVAPGDPNGSYLVQKLDGVDMCSGSRMPRFGTPLTADQMTTITTWICQGAANN
jgi:hypothetical protein